MDTHEEGYPTSTQEAASPPGSIVVVTPNPAIDITYDVPEPRLGETNRVTEVTRRAGGKGVNVASVLLQLEVPVRVSGFLGGRLGQEMEDLLADWPLTQEWLQVEGATTRCTTAIRARDGVTMFSEPGPALCDRDWELLTESVTSKLHRNDVLVVSGSCPPGTTAANLMGLLSGARERGARTVVDTSGPLLVDVAPLCDVVKPNREELAEATGLTDLRAGAQALRARGTGAVVVSDGPRGMYLFTADSDGDRAYYAAAPKVEAVNPTGAGDSAVAAIANDLANHPDTPFMRPEALAAAVALSVSAVLTPVAGVVDLETYNQLLPEIKVEEYVTD